MQTFGNKFHLKKKGLLGSMFFITPAVHIHNAFVRGASQAKKCQNTYFCEWHDSEDEATFIADQPITNGEQSWGWGEVGRRTWVTDSLNEREVWSKITKFCTDEHQWLEITMYMLGSHIQVSVENATHFLCCWEKKKRLNRVSTSQ